MVRMRWFFGAGVLALLVGFGANAQRIDNAMSVTPTRAAPNITLQVNASYLDTSRAHEVRLVGDRLNQLLLTRTPTTSTFTFRVSVPTVPAGSYEVVLVEKPPIGIAEEIGREPLRVLSPLATTVQTGAPQAGKRLSITTNGVVPGMLRVVYGARVIYGPVPTRSSSASLRFLLPADYPSGLPAAVTMKVENLIGTQVINRSSTSLQVAAAWVGPRVAVNNLATSTPNPRANEPFTVSGRLDTFDGVPRSGVTTAFSWLGDDGSVVPLSSDALVLDQQGNFSFQARIDERGYMSARPVAGNGRLVANNRYQTEDDRPQVQTDQSSAIAIFDTDLDADITITVRGVPAGGGPPVPLAEAIVIASASESLQTTFPIPDQPQSGGGMFRARDAVRFSMDNQFRRAMNLTEVDRQLVEIERGCPASGLTKYTNADGRVEFRFVQPTGNQPGGLQADNPSQVGVGLFEQYPCDFDENGLPGGMCTHANVDYIDTEIQIRGMHLGYGHFDPETGAERPLRLRINYNEDNGRINVHGPGPGQLRTFNVSANIFVDLPDAAAYTNKILIGDPWMEGVPRSIDERQGGLRVPHLGMFLDYGYTSAEGVDLTFTNPNALNTRKLRFHHEPDAQGALTSAELWWYETPQSAQKLGDFTRVQSIPECSFVPGGADLYEFLPPAWFLDALRFPQLLTPEGEHPNFIQLEIRVRNGANRTGKRLVHLDFQQPPAAWNQFQSLLIDDSDLFRIEAIADGESLSAQSTAAPDPGYNVGARDNNKLLTNGLYQTVGPQGGVAGQTSLTAGAEQFSRAPDEDLLNAFDSNSNGVIPIGDDDEHDLLNESFPIFYYAWGVPEVLAIELSVNLGLRATYRFFGELDLRGSSQKLTLTSENNFFIMVTPQAEIDVLFGLLFDAGAALPMTFLSSMPVVMENGNIIEDEPCFTFNMLFTAYFDPCNLCPWDTQYDFSEELLSGSTGGGCPGAKGMSPLLPASPRAQMAEAAQQLAKAAPTPEETRALIRHPTLAFDRLGNGHLFALDTSKGLAATKLSGGEPAASALLSTAPNIRHPVIAYYAANRAVAAWVESASSAATLRGLDIAGKTSQQRIAWAHWNGRAWSSKQFLTSAGQGQGHLAIAACVGGEVGCPTPGQIVLVWQSNTSGDIRRPSMRLFHARYTPNSDIGSFTAAAAMQTGISGVQDITPSVDYAAGVPLVVWVRYLGTDLTRDGDRTLAWRYLNETGVGNLGTSQRRIAQPSVEATSARAFRVAFTVADRGQTFAGNHQALYVASAACGVTPCLWSIRRQADEHGRSIYVDRPKLVTDGNGDSSVIARIQRFGNDGSGPVLRDDDPPGVAFGSGDLIQVRRADDSGRSRLSMITADGELHLQANAAFNPATGELAVVSVRSTNPALKQMSSKYRELYPASGRALGKSLLVDEGLGLASIPATPDPKLSALTSATTLLNGGGTLNVQVEVANGGGGYDPARDGSLRLELRFDAATGTGAAPWSVAVPAIAAGGEFNTSAAVPIPASFHNDEPHTLYARLVPAGEEWQELDADNNFATLAFGDLPVPTALRSEVQPGLPVAGLAWDAPDDARVAGYRIYAEDDAGHRFALGSTAVKGFLDLAANFERTRTYYVVSYSHRGIESALSAPIQVTPHDVVMSVIDPLFGDGFETP